MLEILPVITPLFVCAGLGYLWARRGLEFPRGFVTHIVTVIGTPCLAFATLTRYPLELGAFGTLAGVSALAIVAFFILGSLVLWVTGMQWPRLLPPLMLPNAGNMGLPLVLFAYGDEGLARAIAFTSMVMISHHTVGVALASGRFEISTTLRQPVLWAILAAIAFMVAGQPPPAWLLNTTELLGGFAIPLMLLALGVSLAQLGVSTWRISLTLAVVRLTMGFAVGVGLVALVGLTGMERGVVIILCTMPSAVFTYLYAARFQGPEAEVAGTVLLSTVISFATLPLLLWYVL